MANSETISVTCKLCGLPLDLAYEPHGDKRLDDWANIVAQRTVHNECFDKHQAYIRANRENEKLVAAMEKWALLCPPLYQRSENWLNGDQSRNHKTVNRDAIGAALGWQWEQAGVGLLMHGTKTATGKTTAAWLICRREHFAGRAIVAMSHSEFTHAATKLYRDSTVYAERWAAIIKRVDILFIDDLGKSRFTTADGVGKVAEEFLFETVNKRIESGLPTIFTSNLDGDGLEKAMTDERGKAFVRRLREFCRAVNFDAKP